MKIAFLILIFFAKFYFICQMSSTNGIGTTTNFTQNTSAGNPPPCNANQFRIVGDSDISSGCVRLTKPNTSGPGNPVSNFGAMWACNSFSLDSSFLFTANVTFGSGTNTGDGIVFVLKKDAAANKSGGVGGNIGFHAGTIVMGMSLGVEYDTYKGGPGDLAVPDTCDHGQIVRDGDLTNKVGGQTCLKSDGTSINDGFAKNICIAWDAVANTFKAYFEGRLIASAGDIRSYFDTKTVYWGITAGDGNGAEGNLNSHIVCSANMKITDTRLPAPFCVLIPTPVELINFKINSIETKNEVKWQTISERENAFFILERSNDGFNFEKIGEIEGQGNSSKVINYSFIDYNLNHEDVYYRLSQADFDGKISQLEIVYSPSLKKSDFIQNLNSIVENELIIRLNDKKNCNLEYDIFDLSGKKIISSKIENIVDSLDVKVDLSSLSKGTYFVNIKKEEKNKIIKIIKI